MPDLCEVCLPQMTATSLQPHVLTFSSTHSGVHG